MAKATMATVKAFIRKNRANLLISCKSSFDGMTDGVVFTSDRGFYPVQDAEYAHENNMNIAGVWFVFGSRDYITPFEKDGLRGFDIYNCCGSFSLAVNG